MKDRQNTLKNSARYSGVTLHTGMRAHIILKPAPINTGIELVRVDLATKPKVKALATNVVGVERATTIASGEASVHTVEHVLAALYSCGIDNAIIEMDGPEPPIADGSSAPYVSLVLDAGITRQDDQRKFFLYKKSAIC